MLERLPYLYAAILVVEAIALSVVYATAPPAPSDPLSVGLGWAAIGSMVVMLVYSIARRSRRLRRVARLSYWLHFHIFLGLQGVLFAVFHSSQVVTRPAGLMWANPGLLSGVAVLVVFCSGLFGRYLYSWLPRSMGGQQLALNEVTARLDELDRPLPDEARALLQDPPDASGFLGMIRADLARRRALARLADLDLPDEVEDLAARRVDLERKKQVLSAAQRIFRNWIVLHRPLAGVLYVLAIAHIALAYMFSPALGR